MIKRVLLLSTLAWPAMAQTAGTFTQGQVLTAPQLNAALAGKDDAGTAATEAARAQAAEALKVPIAGFVAAAAAAAPVQSVAGLTGALTAAQLATSLSGTAVAGLSSLGVTGTSTLVDIVSSGIIASSGAIAGPGTSEPLVFKDSTYGPVVLTMGGAKKDIEPLLPILLPSTVAWSASVTSAPIWQNAHYTGSTTSATASFGMFLQQTDNSSNTANGVGLYEHLLLNGSGVVGTREAGQFSLTVSAATGNTAPQDYVGIGSTCDLMATDPPGTPASYSVCFGGNPVAHVGAGVLSGGIVGQEVNTWTEAGSVVRDRIGIQVVDVTGSTYGVQATRDDVGFSINNQYDPSSSLGYKLGIEFGRFGGSFPVATNGTLIFGQGFAGAGYTVANGIDWHLGTFTGNSWNDGKIQMTGAGDLLANSATTLATGATAGFLHLPHTTAAPTGTPTNTTPGCEWNTTSHTLNCYDGASWYHLTGTSGAS